MTIFRKVIVWVINLDDIKIRLSKALALAVLLNLVFGLSFYFLERGVQEGLTIVDSLWWAMVTMTTVGYGDYYAQTLLGRFVVSYASMLTGIGIIGYLVGSLAETMLERISKKRRGLMDISIKDHILICNCPNSDKVNQLVQELRWHVEYRNLPIVLVTDVFEELPDALGHLNMKFVKGNPTREDVLHKANVKECSGVFVLAIDPKDPASDTHTFAVGTIIEMIESEIDRPIKVVVELISKANLKMMQRAKTDGIVLNEGVADCLLVQEFLYPGVYDIIQQIISNKVGSQFYIFETKLHGYKVLDIQKGVLDHPANLQVIGIISQGKHILNPPKELCIEKNDKLIMLAESKSDFESVENDIINAN